MLKPEVGGVRRDRGLAVVAREVDVICFVRNNSESTARVAMFSSITAVAAVVYPDSDMIQLFTTDGEDDLVVKRGSAVDVAAPWATAKATGP